jgi:hypothetical protein
MVSKIALLYAITDKTASNIFQSIASAHSNSDVLITQLKLTRKQFYSRMSSLTKVGLVKRHKGRYLLTAFGKVVYSARVNFEARIEDALSNYWKLKAIDSLEISSRQERTEVISVLIDDDEIKNVLIKEEPSLSAQAITEKATIKQL